jgi:hypothetical protein
MTRLVSMPWPAKKASARSRRPVTVAARLSECNSAFRLGHSMIRRAYNWNKIFDNGFGTLDLLFTFSATGGNLGGEKRLLSSVLRTRQQSEFRVDGRPPPRMTRMIHKLLRLHGDDNWSAWGEDWPRPRSHHPAN